MKKLTAILLAAMMFLSSCISSAPSDDPVTNEMAHRSEGGKQVSTYGFDLDNLNYNPIPGITDSTLRKAGEISPLVMENWANAPEVCMDGNCTYIMRAYPREVSTEEEYNAFRSSGKKLCEIEVYENHDYSEPVCTIPLTGLDETHFAVWAFSYNPDDGCFYLLLNISEDGVWENVQNLFLYRFSSDGEYIADSKLENAAVAKYHINKGKVYFVANGGWSGRAGKLICEDPFAGTTEVLHDSVMTVSFSDYVMYYVRVWRISSEGFDAAIFTLDPETGEEIQLARIQPENAELDGEIHIHGACWDAKNEILYITYREDLYAVQNGEKKNVIKVCENTAAPLFIQNGYIVVQVNNQVSVYMLEEEPDSLDRNMITLRIFCSHGKGTDHDSENFLSFLTYALDAMNSTGMSVELEVAYNAAPEEYMNTMAKKFLSGNDDYDLFFVSSEMTNLLDSRYYEDLYQYNVLRDRYDNMLPGLKELCSIDGKTVLIPYVNVITNSMVINNALLGNNYTFDGNYDSFFEFHDMIAENVPEGEVYNTAKSEYNYFGYWFDEIYSNFMARTISDDTARSDILRLFEDIQLRCGNEQISEITNNGNCYAIDITGNAGGIGRYDEAVFPKLGDDYKYSFDMSAIAVNPNSANKEIAVAFLAYYCNVLSTNQRTNNRMLRLFDDKIEEYGYDSASQVYRIQMANSIHRSTNNDFSVMCHNLKRDVISSEVTPAEAASEAFRYMKMARDE